MKNTLLLLTLLFLNAQLGFSQFLDIQFRDQSVTMEVTHSGRMVTGMDEDANNDELYQSDPSSAFTQVFTLESTDENKWYKIYHPASGKYITTTNVFDEGEVELKYDFESGPANQTWKFVKQPVADRYKIHSRHSEGGKALVLEMAENNFGNGDNFRLKKNKTVGNEDHQQFDLINVSASELGAGALLTHATIIGKGYQISNKATDALLGNNSGAPGQLPTPDFGPIGTFIIDDGTDDGKWWTPDARWFHIRNLSNDRFLTVTGTSAGSAVVFDTLKPAFENEEQQFRLVAAPSGSGWYKLRSRLGNLVLELQPNGNLTVETPKVAPAPRQKFAFNLDIPDDPAVKYAVVSKPNVDYLTDEGIYGSIGAEVSLKRKRQPSPAVYWNFIDAGNGYFKIQNALTKQFIVSEGNGNLSDQIVAVRMESPVAATDKALWELKTINDNFRFKSKHSGFFLGSLPLNENIKTQLITDNTTKWYLYRVEALEAEGAEAPLETIEDSPANENCLVEYGNFFKRGLAERVGLPAEPQYFEFIRSAIGYFYGKSGEELDQFMSRIRLDNDDHRGYLALAVRQYIAKDLAFRAPSTWTDSETLAVNKYQQRIRDLRQDYGNRLDQKMTQFQQIIGPNQTPTFSVFFEQSDAASFLWPEIYKPLEVSQAEKYTKYIHAGANLGLKNELLPQGALTAIGFAGGIGTGITVSALLDPGGAIYNIVKNAFKAAISLVKSLAPKGISLLAADLTVKMATTLTAISSIGTPLTVATISVNLLVVQVQATIETVQLEKDIQDVIDWANQPVNIANIMQGNNLVDKIKLLNDLDYVVAVPVPNQDAPFGGVSTFGGYIYNFADNQYATPFTLNCFSSVVVSLDENTGEGSLNLNDVVSNAPSSGVCGGVISYDLPQTDFTCEDVGIFSMTVGASNDRLSRQCNVQIHVIDQSGPTVVCRDRTIQLDENGYKSIQPDLLESNAFDACGIASRALSQGAFDCDDVGELTITLTVFDPSGNQSSCESTVTVVDDTAPDAQCAPLTLPLSSNGTLQVAPSQIDDGSYDACEPLNLELSQTVFDCSSVGLNPVTLTVTDQNNNSSTCNTTVTVLDDIAPNTLCKNITLSLDNNGTASIIPADVDDGSFDACGIASLSLNTTDFLCTDRGTNTLELTVTDNNGNSSSCTATVNVVDDTAPTIKCHNPTVAIEPDGDYELSLTDVYDAAQSFDNCGIVQSSFPATTYTCDEADLSYSVPVTIEDEAGNQSSCFANVQVVIGTALPAGWSTTDVGYAPQGNTYSFDPCTDPDPQNGEFTITGAGNNAVSTTTDNVAFASQTLCGDGMITAKIESVTPNGYGGLMMRESTAAGSKQVAIFSNLTNVLRHEARSTTNSPKTVQSHYRPFPIWLRLQRMGDWVFAYYSTTGTSFSYVHAVYVPMQNCVEIGLASFTYLPNAQTEAVFSNVSISGSAALAGSDVPDILQPETTQAGLQAELFPNPARDAFALSFPETLPGEATATLRNQIGQVVEQRQLKPGDVTTEWNVSGLPSGLYFMEVRQEGVKPQVLRVVKSN
jgi:hypothetical protein